MRYINSDMLRHLFEVWKEIEEKAGNDKGAYCYNECINAIDKTPPADVVEVVRCGDCKHIDLNSADPIVWNGIASALCRCDLHERSVRVEDFCSYGERKEDE